MAKMTLDELTQSLRTNKYTPRTDNQLQQEAQNRYSSTYNQKRQTAQQSYDTKNLAYENQMQNLQDTLRQNQQELARQTENSRLQAARYQVTRGMQRSSYGAANDANIMNSGLGEQQKLMNQFSTDSNAIKSNQTLLAQQLADTLAGYDIDYLNDVNAYIDEQKQLDYDRQTAADKTYNDLQMALYEYGQNARSGGSSRRRSSSAAPDTSTDDDANNNNNSLWDSLNNGQKAPVASLVPKAKKNTGSSGKTEYKPATKTVNKPQRVSK